MFKRMISCLLIFLLTNASIVLPPFNAIQTANAEGSASKKLVFQSNRTGNNDIFVMNADGSNQTQLTTNTASDQNPAFSPDGTKIAFQSIRDGNSEIYVMNADGSAQVNISNNSADDQRPAFSPDGSKIVFQSTRDGGKSNIFVMNIDGTNQTQLTFDSVGANKGTYSPDGSKIAFESGRDGNQEIYIMDADGSNQTRLTNDPAIDRGSDFSSDGLKIIWMSQRDGNPEIYEMNTDGSNPVNLTNNTANDGGPAYSFDGEKIAFQSNRNGNNEIYSMNPDGSNPVNLTSNPANDNFPDWGPGSVAAPPNQAPVLGLIGNKTVDEGSSLTFTLNATDFDGDPLTYSATGTAIDAGANFNPITRQFTWTPDYNQAGSYHVNFTVDDARGGTDSEDITIDVNAAPTANFSYTPSKPTGSDTIQFTDQSTDSDGHIVAWLWEFGDGSISTEQNPARKLIAPFLWDVKLTVTDNDGAQSFFDVFVFVSRPAVGNGIVWATGANFCGEIGIGWVTTINYFTKTGLTDFVSVDGGQGHSLALKSDGTVWTAGLGANGQLGLGDFSNKYSFTQVPDLTGVVSIASGDFQSLALKNDGTVWVTGRNDIGQIGLGDDPTDRNSFTQVPDLTGVVSIASGGYYSLALKSDGTVWTTGENRFGQLGLGDTTDRHSFTQVPNLTGVVSIACGAYHSLALKSDGTVWTAGGNYYDYGALGLGDNGSTDYYSIYDSNRNSFTQVPDLTNVVSIAGGYFFSLAIKNDGTVWVTGRNDIGQIGLGDTTNRYYYTQVPDLTSVVSVSGGANHSLALKSDGTVWTTGYNYYGQLGLGDNSERHSFAQTDLANAFYIAAGSDFSLAITEPVSNVAPTADSQTVSTNEDTQTNITLSASDANNDPLAYSIVDQPAHGTLTGSGTDWTYLPQSNYYGDDSFTFKVNDGKDDSNVATVNISVAAVNDAPSADNDSAVTDEDAPVTINVLVNDSDIDGDTLNIESVTSSTHGNVIINPDGTLAYTPDENYNGTDTLNYSVSDGNGGTAVGTVNITVNPVNDTPVLEPIENPAVDENSSNSVDISANDIDGDPLTITIENQPNFAGLADNGDGTAILSVSPGFEDVGQYNNTKITVSDGSLSDTKTITITVNNVNRSPVADDQSLVTDEDTWLPLTLTGFDPDNEVLVYAISSNPVDGILLGTGANLTYVPLTDYDGQDTFAYTVTDTSGVTATGTVKITINPVNDTSAATNDAATTDEDIAVTIDVLANDTDADGDVLSIVSFNQGIHGLVALNSDLTLTYTPQTDYNGTDTFTYSITDGHGGVSTAMVTVTVNAVNDAPVVSAGPNQTVNEGTVVNLSGTPGDIDGDTLSYSWTQITGPSVNLANADSLTPVFTAPQVDQDTVLTFEVKVSDGMVNVTDSVDITVRNVVPPFYEKARTIGYWKNHPDNLSAILAKGQIDLGDTVVTGISQAISILSASNAKDARYALRTQLLATILNLGNNSNPLATGSDIRPVVDQAKNFLVTHPNAVTSTNPDRSTATTIKDKLDTYNNSGEYSNSSL